MAEDKLEEITSEPVVPDVDLGKQLQEARRKKDLSPDEAAKHLKLSKEIIVRLETEQWDFFSSRTYVRGYISSYAKFLGLPVEDMLILFDKVYLKTEEQDNLSPYGPNRIAKRSSGFLLQLVLIALLLAVIVGVVSIWGSTLLKTTQTTASNLVEQLPFEANKTVTPSDSETSSKENTTNKDTTIKKTNNSSIETDKPTTEESDNSDAVNTSVKQQDQPEADTSSSLVQDSNSSETNDVNKAEMGDVSQEVSAVSSITETNTNTQEQTTDQKQDVSSEQAAIPKQDAKPEQEAVAAVVDASSALIKFHGTCWVGVTNKQGKLIINKEMVAGQTLTVKDVNNSIIKLGKADRAEVIYKGQSVDLTPYTRNGVATIVLKG